MLKMDLAERALFDNSRLEWQPSPRAPRGG